MARPAIVAALVAALLASSRLAAAGFITLDLDPNGTTSNLNVYGTTLSGGVATWPSRAAYRDYQFELHTDSGTTTFDGFAVRLSAYEKNKTPASNTLRATLWQGPMQANPLLADQLVTATISNDAWFSTTSFRSAVLNGPSFSPVTITTSPTVFFFRVWAEGDGNNNGFATKMAATLGEFQSITMQETVPVDASIAYDADDDGIIDHGETYDVIDVVPEIDLSVLGNAAVLVCGRACLAGTAAAKVCLMRPPAEAA